MKILTRKQQTDILQTVIEVYLIGLDTIGALQNITRRDYRKRIDLLAMWMNKVARALDGQDGESLVQSRGRQHALRLYNHFYEEWHDLDSPPLPTFITIDDAVRVFGDTFPSRRQKRGKFRQALRKEFEEEIEVDIPVMEAPNGGLK